MDLRLWHHQKPRHDSSSDTTHHNFRMGSNTSKEEVKATVEQPVEEDDEPDEW